MKSKVLWSVGFMVALGLPAWGVVERSAAGANNAPAKAPATIISPKRDETVTRWHEVVGKAAIAGQPIVLVRPQSLGGEWYVQAPVEVDGRGNFKSKVCFGSDLTKPGAKFQVAVIVLRTAEEVEFFKGKEVLLAIPETFLQTEAVSVVLGTGEVEVAAKLSGAILTPTANLKVKSLQEITGKLTTKGWPVVLVRSDEANEEWWVQGSPKINTKGAFASTAQFGNEKTPSGKRFRLTFLTLPSVKEAAAFAIGSSLPKLPSDIPHAEPVTVILDRPEAAVAIVEAAEAVDVVAAPAAEEAVNAAEVVKE